MKIKLLNKINEHYVDVLIIGGNLTGLMTALNLDSNLKTMIVDKNFIGNNLINNDQVINTNGFNYQKIINIFPTKYLMMYSNVLLETISAINDINSSNVKNVTSFKDAVYMNTNNKFNLKKYILKLKKKCLRNNIIINEYTKVLTIKKYQNVYKCKTNKSIITASKVIIACQDFNNLLPFSSFLKVYKFNDKIFTNDGLPYIGCFKAGDNTLLVSYGYNNYVIENSIIAADILSDLIVEKENSLVPLLSPNRHSFKYNLKIIPINLFNNLKNFINNNLINKFGIKKVLLLLKSFNITFSNAKLLLKERVK